MKTIKLDIPANAADRVRSQNEWKPVANIFHRDGRWHVECEAQPQLNLSSVTLWSLLNHLRDRVTPDVETSIKQAQG